MLHSLLVGSRGGTNLVKTSTKLKVLDSGLLNTYFSIIKLL